MLCSEFRVAKMEREQAGEAWTRTNDELQRTKAYDVPQSTPIFNKSSSDNESVWLSSMT